MLRCPAHAGPGGGRLPPDGCCSRRRRENWWTEQDAAEGRVPGNASYVPPPAARTLCWEPENRRNGLALLCRDRLADILELRPAGERNIARRMLEPGRRDDDRSAVHAVLAYRQCYTTMAQLVAACLDLDCAWLEALCFRPSGRILYFGDVEDRVRAQRVLLAAGAAVDHGGCRWLQ